MKAIGITLKAIRLNQFDSLPEASNKLGVSSENICQMESGKQTPSLELIEKYKNTYHFSCSEILYIAETIQKMKDDNLTNPLSVDTSLNYKVHDLIYKTVNNATYEKIDDDQSFDEIMDEICAATKGFQDKLVKMNNFTSHAFRYEYQDVTKSPLHTPGNPAIFTIRTDETIEVGYAIIEGNHIDQEKMVHLALPI
jgi:DNA-binding XRE family transcriptional regulator